MLVAQRPAGKGRAGLGQLVHLAGDGDAFDGGAGGKAAFPAEPAHQADRAIRGVLARFVETPQPLREDRLERIDPHLADQDQDFAQVGPVSLRDVIAS